MRVLLVVLNMIYGADAATTTIIIHRGGREILLPTQNTMLCDGIVAAQAVGLSYLVHRMDKHHHKLAMTLGIEAAAIRGAIVAHNMRELQ